MKSWVMRNYIVENYDKTEDEKDRFYLENLFANCLDKVYGSYLGKDASEIFPQIDINMYNSERDTFKCYLEDFRKKQKAEEDCNLKKAISLLKESSERILLLTEESVVCDKIAEFLAKLEE